MSRHSVTLRLVGLALVTLLSWAPVSALAYDPALKWQTIVTPNFRLHYPEGQERPEGTKIGPAGYVAVPE